MQTGCDICGSVENTELFEAYDRLKVTDQPFSLSRCSGCGVIRTLPEMKEEDLAPYYAEDYWGGKGEPKVEWIRKSQREKIKFLKKCVTAGGKILDVGCGSGLFLRALDSGIWERYGVEIGETAAAAAARHLGDDRIFRGNLSEARYVRATFDVVTFWASIEHMNNPREMIQETGKILKPGGLLIIQVPNAGGYQARWFKDAWFALDVPRHRYHFTRDILSKLLEESHFKIARESQYSKTHNAHALKQSLKFATSRNGKGISYFLCYLSTHFLRPADLIMTPFGGGATLTIAARAI